MKPAVAALTAATVLLLSGCNHAAPNGNGAAPHTPVEAAATAPTSVESPAVVTTNSPGSLSFSDSSGTVKIGRGAVDPLTLDVPLYPGSVQDSANSFSSLSSDGLTEITTLDSGDSYVAILAWYKGRLPRDTRVDHVNVGTESTTSFEWIRNGGREDRILTITTNHGKPLITISLKTSNGQ